VYDRHHGVSDYWKVPRQFESGYHCRYGSIHAAFSDTKRVFDGIKKVSAASVNLQEHDFSRVRAAPKLSISQVMDASTHMVS
jgi:hypothetical protein